MLQSAVTAGHRMISFAIRKNKLSRSVRGKLALTRFHSSYERGCQEKSSLPFPCGRPRLVTYSQPCLLLRGAFGFTALGRRAFQRRCQPQLLSLTQRFHAVALDACRL